MTRQECEKFLHLAGRLKNVVSGRQLGLVQEETLVVFCKLMPGDRQDNVK